jgi:c-di-GMP-binding flagellar brake protein YcgR
LIPSFLDGKIRISGASGENIWLDLLDLSPGGCSVSCSTHESKELKVGMVITAGLYTKNSRQFSFHGTIKSITAKKGYFNFESTGTSRIGIEFLNLSTDANVAIDLLIVSLSTHIQKAA